MEDLCTGAGHLQTESCATCPNRDSCACELELEHSAGEADHTLLGTQDARDGVSDDERGPAIAAPSGLRPGIDVEAGLLAKTIKYSTPGISKRQKSRLAGPSGNHWYALEIDANVRPGQVVAVVFWKTPIAVWRDEQGQLTVMEDRCAHRQLRLSKGLVGPQGLTCCYHGWVFDKTGKLVSMAHEVPKTFTTMPNVRLRVFPHKIKYGLIFVFPGDPALADATPLPVIPSLDKDPPLPFRFVDMTVNAHWSMIIENNCDFYHAHLHRRYKPFWWPYLLSVAREGDKVHVEYDVNMEDSAGARYLGGKSGKPLNYMKLWFDYPYQRSNLVDKYLHWMFATPIDERTTRTIYVFLWEAIEVGPIKIPYSIRPPILYLIHKLYLVPVLSQDLGALEEEQIMNDQHSNKASVEMNSLVSAFQQLTIEKWDAYLSSEKARRKLLTLRDWRLTYGAGLSDWRWGDI